MMRIANKPRSKLLFLYFFLCGAFLFFFIINSGNYFYPLSSNYSDLTISHLPNLLFLKQSILEYGQIPFWSNQILSGYPFLANPLSEIWYLPNWLNLFLPQPLGYNLLFFAHVVFGGAGILFYLRKSGKGIPGSLTGAMIFVLLPKIFAQFALGHVTLIFAISWTPWLLLAEKMRQSEKRSYFKKMGTGIVLGIILLADVRWGAYAAIFIFLFSLYLFGLQLTLSRGNIPLVAKGRLFLNWIYRFGIQILFSIFCAAPLLLPMLQYVSLSTRSFLTAEDHLFLSISPAKLLGFFFPDVGAYAEWVIYAGSLFSLILLCSLIFTKLRKESFFWLILFGLSVFYALGDNIFLNRILSGLPGMSLLRVPGRTLFLTGISAAVLTANFLDYLIHCGLEKSEIKKFNLAGIGLFLFESIITFIIAIITREFPGEFVWGLTASLVGFLLIKAFLISHDSMIAACLIFLILVDLSCVNYFGLHFRSKCDVDSEGAEEAAYISRQPGVFRVYSPSYSISQLTAATLHLELADGIDPLHLIAYSEYFELATSIPQKGYSVTLPPFENGKPETDNKNYDPNAAILGKLNVRYIVSAFPLSEDELLLVKETENNFIYENPSFLPRAWVQKANEKIGEGILSIPETRLSPNEIIVDASGPGLLVLSEINYPGWKVEINGTPEKFIEGEIFRTILLTEESNNVRIYYYPIMTIYGLFFSIAAILFILSTTFLKRKKNDQ